MPVKAILKIIAITVIALIGLTVLWHLFQMLVLLAYTVGVGLVAAGGLAVLALICYGLLMLFKPKDLMRKVAMQPRVWDMHGQEVFVFRNEPALVDLVKLHDELHMAQLELQGDVFLVPNDSAVIVLEDNGKESVKIRLKDAKKKAVDAEGWISRSSLVQQPKRISGPQ